MKSKKMCYIFWLKQNCQNEQDKNGNFNRYTMTENISYQKTIFKSCLFLCLYIIAINEKEKGLINESDLWKYNNMFKIEH